MALLPSSRLLRGRRPWGGDARRIPDAAPQRTKMFKRRLDRWILFLRWLYRVRHKWSPRRWREGFGSRARSKISTSPDGRYIRGRCPSRFLWTKRRLPPWAGARPVSRHLTEQSIHRISLGTGRLRLGYGRIHGPSITVARGLANIPDLCHSFVAGNRAVVHFACIQEVHPVVRLPSTFSIELFIGRTRWGAEQTIRVAGAPISIIPCNGTSIQETSTVWQAQILKIVGTDLLF